MATKRLIDATPIIDECKECSAIEWNHNVYTTWADAEEDFMERLLDAPIVDAVEVVHGRWISEVVRKLDWKGKMRDYYQASSCSVCHKPDPGYGTSNYCPNCGAKMDGGEDNGE